MAVYEGRWDCQFCGHKGVSGPKTHCTQCGGSRSVDVHFYLPDDHAPITDEELLEKANQGPNWNCSNCSSSNEHWNKFCGSCGSIFSEQDRDIILKEREYAPGQAPNSGDVKPEPEKVTQRKKLSKNGKATGILATIAAMLFAFLSTFESPIDVEVIGHEWKRIIHIDAYRQVEEESWKVPPSGKVINSYKAVHHYNQRSRGFETRTRTVKVKVGDENYVCGKIDTGNGYFKDKYCSRPIYKNKQETYQEEVFEQIPVYATKYRYKIHRWLPDTPLVTKGNDHQPKWGEKAGLEDKQRYRISRRQAEYTLLVKDHKGETHYEPMEFARWEKINKGDMLPAIKSAVYGYYKSLDLSQKNFSP